MRRLLVLAAVAALTSIAFASSAAAKQIQALTVTAPVRECGVLQKLFRGYEQAFNVTSRDVDCSSAGDVAYALAREIVRRGYDHSWPRRERILSVAGWTALLTWYRTGPFYVEDIRSTASGGRVVHFQFGGY